MEDTRRWTSTGGTSKRKQKRTKFIMRPPDVFVLLSFAGMLCGNGQANLCLAVQRDLRTVLFFKILLREGGEKKSQGLAKAACMPRGRENNAIIYYPSDPGHIKPVHGHFLPLLHKPPLHPSTYLLLFLQGKPNRLNQTSCPAKKSWCVHIYFPTPITPSPIANCFPWGI